MVGQQQQQQIGNDDEEQVAILLHKRHPEGGYGAASSDDDDEEEEKINPRAAAFREARQSYLSFSQPVGGAHNYYYTATNGGGGGPGRGGGGGGGGTFFNSVRAYYTVRDNILSHTFVFDRGLLASVREAEGTATAPASILNLCKNVIGAGVLVRACVRACNA